MGTLFLPIWTLALTFIFSLQDVVKVAYILVACSPGGQSSNMYCFLTGSDLSLSLAMTAVSTLFCMGMMPLNMFWTTKVIGEDNVDIPLERIVLSLLVILLGCGAGIGIKCYGVS